MSHDIDDLLNLIKELEERIIKLERFARKVIDEKIQQINHEDSWYWEHG